MASSNQDLITSKITLHRRNQTPKFKCDICATGQTYLEASWWKHYTQSHADLIAGLGEEAKSQFREAKKEVCEVKRDNAGNNAPGPADAGDDKGRPKNDQVESQEQVGWVNVTIQSSTGPGNHGITGKLEELKIQPVTHQQETAVDADIEMADQTAASPIGETIRVAQAPQFSSRQRQRAPTTTTEKRTRRARGGQRGRREPFDSDFDRSLPNAPIPTEDGTKLNRRLFDPSRDTVASFKAEDSSQRLDTAATSSPQNHSRNPTGTGRRKENKKKELNFRNGPPEPFEAPPSMMPLLPPPQQSLAQLYPGGQNETGREGGRPTIFKNYNQLQSTQQQRQQSQPLSLLDQPPPEDEESLRLVRQPETRPISPEQLISEVKGIYAGLVMVEAKCIEVDQRQAALAKQMEAEGLKQPKLNNEQWQALIALHRTLLHEHHDFFLASQHPSASPALRRLASKYTMPARMWRHGIHSFLELLRHRLPHSLEHMLTFIYLAYSIMALLYETVPAFEDTWIECLGDLGRYRMAIEDDDVRDREVWTNVARMWYSKAADKMPTVGRLYHHLAILARPHVLQQLFFYCKSLSVSCPFSPARESILALFEPVFASSPNVNNSKSQPVDMALITLHGICFTHIDFNKFGDALYEFLSLLDNHIQKVTTRWKVQGCHIAVCNIAALYEYGARGSKLRRTIRDSKQGCAKDQEMEDAPPASVPEGADYDTLLPPLPTEASSEHVTSLLPSTSKLGKEATLNYKAAVAAAVKSEQSEEASELYLGYAKRLAFSTLDLVLHRIDDPHILPHIHAWLAFMYFLVETAVPAVHLLESDFPWDSLVTLLNAIVSGLDSDKYENAAFPTPDKGIGRPLPEDWTLRGLEWTKRYFPEGWIENALVDDEERLLELPSMAATRIERIAWLAVRICNGGDWLVYDSSSRTFAVNLTLIQRINGKKIAEAASQEQGKLVIKKEEEEEDMDMDAPEYLEEDIDDIDDIAQSEELKQLVVKRKQLRSQLKTEKTEDLGMNLEAIPRFNAKEGLKPNYTVLVVDTNLLLSSLDTFKAMLRTDEWSVVIPNTVVTELLGLSNDQGTIGESAKVAMLAIQDAVGVKKDVRVITAKGNNVTSVGFFKEKLEKYNEEDMNIDDVIINIAEMQGKLRAENRRAEGVDAGQAQGAILITEDRNMRVKANARGVPAIAGTVLKMILSPRDIARSRPKRKSSTTPLMTSLKQKFPEAPEEVLVMALQDANGDLETAIYHVSQQYGPSRQLQLRPQSPNFKKRHKREKNTMRGTEAG